jgi:hypothetical protein
MSLMGRRLARASQRPPAIVMRIARGSAIAKVRRTSLMTRVKRWVRIATST